VDEITWLACTDPDAMLHFLRGRVSERKLRLFACACIRRIWPLLPDGRCRRAVEVIERCADGLAGRAELQAALADAESVEAASTGAARTAVRAVVTAWSTAEHARSAAAQASHDPAGERRRQADLLRDLVGNPFRPAPVKLAWLEHRGGRVAQIARTIYDGRRFADLPVLADALEESGCTDAAILAHCRSGGDHALGCWVLDSLLGTPVLADAPDGGLTPWTVQHPVEQEGRYVRQASYPGHYAVVTLRVEPYPGPTLVVFLNAAQASRDTPCWVPAVEEGIRQFVVDQAQQGQRIVGTRAVLTRLADHPVDSQAASFERAASSAMAQVFEAAGIPGLPG
jgi:hypothetical protein